jgi:four helix bundle protein
VKVRSYRELKVWQHSMKLAEEIYCLTEKFPKYETYALSNQMQRAVVSIPSIAEGHARESTKEFLHHISIALGSWAAPPRHSTLANTRVPTAIFVKSSI